MANNQNKGQRITVTLEAGHREQLEEIAEHNRVKLAFVVRFAISEFLANPDRGKTLLNFSSGGTEAKHEGDRNDE